VARLARIVLPHIPHHIVQRARAGLNLFADGKLTRLAGNLPGPADIGFDPAGGKVAVPQLTENKVELFDVSSIVKH